MPRPNITDDVDAMRLLSASVFIMSRVLRRWKACRWLGLMDREHLLEGLSSRL